MLYTSKDFDRMSVQELQCVTENAISLYSATAANRQQAGIPPNISAAWMNAERLQSLANMETDREEAAALSREAAAARNTLAILFEP